MATEFPHAKHNMTALAASKNVQKQRKPNPKIDELQNVYWDLRGRYQEEYDKRLDALPQYGEGATKASEIFRAATKLYYDFWNNGMVNNTSGAANFLIFAGVFHSQEDQDFAVIYPYTIGSRIYLNEEMGLRSTLERMIDRTIAFLLANNELDALPNDTNYLDFSQQSEVNNLDRCTMRNIHFLRMKENVAATVEGAAAEEEEATDAKLMKAHGAKAQDCIMKKKNKGKKKRVPSAKNLVNIIIPISKK
mmetsp:Transcript_6120/g.9541  ORF Transcript_6120/g.9541 Transcript_6120/m.9541 type:complete len:249 (+) Transcript_6120:139-885(+)